MNRVLICGRLTRDPEMRKLASGKTVTTFSVATNDYRAGAEKATVVTEMRAASAGPVASAHLMGSCGIRSWAVATSRTPI